MTRETDNGALEMTRPVKMLAPGAAVSHYRIVEKLGEGGMGVVYRAEDTRLRRQVALKFLPPHLTSDPAARERFLIEAQAASALDHANICTIHEIDETEDGQTFIAMACYEGQTLKERIGTGRIEPDEAIDIACQVASGLARAHAKGIVHRDIKPANLMLTPDGTVKIMDFGLAKLSGQVGVTRVGTIMGTVTYMSPEQVRGGELDGRTDIWSLGVVLYEMLSQKLPFRGANDQAVIYSILNDDPPGLTAALPAGFGALGEAVTKALQKDRELRYRDAAEFNRALEVCRAGKPDARVAGDELAKSIVVLPFDDISPGRDNEYFSDGLTEEIISDLSQMHDLRVISRTSAMRLKGTDKSVREIGSDLGVSYVLEGSVRKAGDSVRITAQLIDARADSHMWAEKYKGTLEDIFDIQEQVSRAIVEALRVKLSPSEDRKVSARPIADARAYDYYLRAKTGGTYGWTEEGLQRALKYLHKGLEVIGESALLYAAIGLAHYQYINIGISADEAYLRKAEEYADKALALDPESPQALHVLANIDLHAGNIERSVSRMKRVLASYPSDTGALGLLVLVYSFSGKPDAARPFLERFRELDPLDPLLHIRAAVFYWTTGEFALALEEGMKGYGEDPEHFGNRAMCGLLYLYNQRSEESFSMFERLAGDYPEHFVTKMYLFMMHAFKGKRSEAVALLDPEFEAIAARDQQYAWHMTTAYSMLGDADKGFEWLNKALDRGFVNYPMLAEYDPFLDCLRRDERYPALAERVREMWEDFTV